MKTKLMEAIHTLTNDDLYDIGPSIQEHIDIVLAAALAYACEECGGGGYVGHADPDDDLEVDFEDCSECKADREVADAD